VPEANRPPQDSMAYILERSRTELELRNSSCRDNTASMGHLTELTGTKADHESLDPVVECNELSSALHRDYVGGTSVLLASHSK
jgi:hypothetical protein